MQINSVTIVDGAAPGSVVRVEWADGTAARFHALWLRENATDPSTRSPVNGQRLITICDIPADVSVAAVAATASGDAVDIRFAPGDEEVHFDSTWLFAHRYDRDRTKHSQPGWVDPTIERWTAATMQSRIPTASLSTLTGDRTALRDWLRAIARFGFAHLSDVPPDSGRLCDVVDLFGYVRETNYGRWFDVRAEVDPTNLAYTNLGLQAHTDNPYRDPVPTLQVLACLENSVDGGASAVIDGFAAAQRLQMENPQGFDLLTRHNARFSYTGSVDVHLCAKRPMIELGPDGELVAVRFNNRSADALVDVPFDDMESYLAAVRQLSEIIDDPHLAVTFTLRPGELFVVDNTRVLHARTAFSGCGQRWLQGCYADKDGLLSTLRVLDRELAS